MTNKFTKFSHILLLLLILASGAYLRFTGLSWGELQHQHPDELFLSSVTSSVMLPASAVENFTSPPTSKNQPARLEYPEVYPDCAEWGGFWDTACSPLNPYNRGYTFYVYGTLPLFIVRALAEWGNQLDNIKLFGRQMSAVADMFTLLLVFLIALRLYRRRVALLATAFSALAVTQIQQSHFYTTDNFAVTFMTLAVYFAVEIIVGKKCTPPPPSQLDAALSEQPADHQIKTVPWQYLWQREITFSLLFGIAFGMAVASKLTAAPLALLLPLAFFVREWRQGAGISRDRLQLILTALVIGGFFAVLSFRVFQPYAFSGLGLNPAWVANIREQRAQATPESTLPWNLQWARRTHLYSFENLTLWGLGLPLGILAWAGFLWMGWRMLNGKWRRHLLLWGWTAAYFGWQSLQYNPTMRYQLPIYPFLAVMAAWAAVTLIGNRQQIIDHRRLSTIRRTFAILIIAIVLLSTAGYAFAFSRIYVNPESRIAASKWVYQNVPAAVNLQLVQADGNSYQQPLVFPSGAQIAPEATQRIGITPRQDGALTALLLAHVVDSAEGGEQTLTVYLANGPNLDSDQILASASVRKNFVALDDPRGEPVTLTFNQPVEVEGDQMYYLIFETTGGELTFSPAAVINETDYDWSLPFRVDGYDAFGGLYGDLNLQVYWDDNAEKLERFQQTLDEGDYIFIPTNHQYAQITRLPERHPLTTAYYRALMGCPDELSEIACYRVAEPGVFIGQLGYELVSVFTDYPTLGSLEINDQTAEEAFTFYDHPKVFVFAKTADYDPARVAEILGAVDLDKVMRVTPKQADTFPANLMLPDERLAEQRAGGTWAEIFNTDALQNRSHFVGALLWYLSVFLLGLVTYPLVRFAMSGLDDRGYPLARITGLLLLAWLVWMAGSARIPFTRLTIGVVLLLMTLLGGGLAYKQREGLRAEWREKRNYFLTVEGLFLLFFLVFLLIRLGNPDLWHPWKGGEKPMDLSYFNAVLKSTSFPPYDPWFAGGYINYYYYGYVVVGVLVKFLGIVPTFAYNLILPTLYSLVAMGAFSIVWNLYGGTGDGGRETEISSVFRLQSSVALGGALAMSTLGNLGVLQMLLRGYQRLIVPSDEISSGGLFQRLWWAAQGFAKSLGSATLNYRLDEWYWNPSRVIDAAHGNPITEFPFFTFLYADLHAHMIALPIALLVVAWALSVVQGKAWAGRATPGRSPLRIGLSFFLGGLAIGALYPANLSDIYTYLPLGIAAVVYVIWRYVPHSPHPNPLPGEEEIASSPFGGGLRWGQIKRLALMIGGALLLTALAKGLYQPYAQWYSQGYSEFKIWPGSHTPTAEYLTHWGLFLFVIVSWMFAETIDWMANTPVSALRKLEPYKGGIVTGLILLVAVILLLGINLPYEAGGDSRLPLGLGIHIVWFVLPLVAWAGVLMLRPNISDARRFVLFLTGTALMLSLTVEIIYVIGDIGRMNLVFKFYLHAWTLLSVSAAAALGWLLPRLNAWKSGGRVAWQVVLVFLLGVAGLYPVLGSFAKIEDRMTADAPHNLDGMTYMQSSIYYDEGAELDLSEDYAAIRWMQANVVGSPVIVEGNQVEYHWGTRYTIYTGLPSVIGWNWHQRQQRTIVPHDWIYERVDGTHEFYLTEDIEWAQNFLQRYAVSYIVLGQFERAKYAGPGLEKFSAYEGQLWAEVFRVGETVIYAVIRDQGIRNQGIRDQGIRDQGLIT